MKIILLDFDGPIIPTRAWAQSRADGYPISLKSPDPIAGAIINQALKNPDTYLVISSSWRRQGREVCESVLKKAGIDVSKLHDVWHTPIGPSRTGAILQWVEENLDSHDEWVAIDDANLKLDDDNYVRVTIEDGILWSHHLEIYKKLGLDPF